MKRRGVSGRTSCSQSHGKAAVHVNATASARASCSFAAAATDTTFDSFSSQRVTCDLAGFDSRKSFKSLHLTGFLCVTVGLRDGGLLLFAVL